MAISLCHLDHQNLQGLICSQGIKQFTKENKVIRLENFDNLIFLFAYIQKLDFEVMGCSLFDKL